MRTFGVVIDSSTNLNLIDEQFKDASVVSLSFMLEDHEVLNHQVTPYELINAKKLSVISPKPESFIKAYEEQKNLGYKDVFIFVSSTYFSDSLNQAILAKTILGKPDFHIIDTKTFSSGINQILYQLTLPDNYDESALAIKSKIDTLINTNQTILVTRDLPNNFIKNLLPFNHIIDIKDDLNIIKSLPKLEQVFKYVKLRIENEKKLGYEPYVLIMYNNLKEAKILQQELFTLLNINIYIDDMLPNLIYTKFKKPLLGITIGRN